MSNNDILKRIRYIFDYEDSKMIELFGLGDLKTDRAEVSNWLKKEYDEEFKEIRDRELAMFLNGLINDKRGKREGVEVVPEKYLDNNIILRKLKIAFNLRTDDMLDIFKKAGKPIGPHELSAFFRNPKQSKYRECQDQYLRNFLLGLQAIYRKEKG
jgi:uncharacterized protein YehS (DUF1456 family)